MGTFVEGDNGRELIFSCGFKNLKENDRVEISIKFGDKIFTKQAEVFYPQNGRCKVTLTPLEINEVGIYEYQCTTYFADGRELTDASIKSFKVSEKLNGTPFDSNVLDGGSFTDVTNTTLDGGEF